MKHDYVDRCTPRKNPPFNYTIPLAIFCILVIGCALAGFVS